jgi:hypothetical protein
MYIIILALIMQKAQNLGRKYYSKKPASSPTKEFQQKAGDYDNRSIADFKCLPNIKL